MTSVVMMHVSILWTTCGVNTCLVTQLNAIRLLLFFHNVFFLPFPTHCYPPFSFFCSFWSLYCFVLPCHSDHSQSMYLYFFSLILFLHFLHFFPPSLLCLSMYLLSSWPEGPSLPLWLFLTVECAWLQIFVMLIGHSFSGYTGRHHRYI